MNLVDIGANLTHESFADDLDEVLSSAAAVGVNKIILTGTDLASTEAALTMAEANPQLFAATAGFHPHVASTFKQQELLRISELASHPQVVAVGETGLDFNRNFSPKEAQLQAFEQHLQLAVHLSKPVFLHQRDAHDEFLRLLSKYRADLSGGVVHCFTDSEAALDEYLQLDMYIGITGWICDERRGKDLQQLVGKIPANRLLIETDAPYLLPRTIVPKPKTRRNEPKYLPEIVKTIAKYSDRSAESIARDSSANAVRLFELGTGLSADR